MSVQNKREDLMVTTADSDGGTVMTEDNWRQLLLLLWRQMVTKADEKFQAGLTK